MSDSIITVENLSKRYRLGEIGATSLRESVQRWWHRTQGRNPRHHMEEIQEGGAGSIDLPDEIWALRDVSFEVERGEVLGVIGKNGAGKSTLLKLLTRVTEPTSGRAILRGRVASLLEVGTGFHPELTGRENVFLNGAILGMRRAETAAKFDEIVDFSGVERFIDTPVKRYSSGMYVRLAFAVAVHLEPEILLVDEVLAVGDVGFQKKCIGKMGKIAGEGKTVLVVSHSMSTVKALCSRALLLEDGAVKALGTPDDVVSEYLGGAQVDRDEKKVSVADHSQPNSDIHVTSVRLLHGSGSGFSVFWKQPITVSFTVEVHKRFEGVVFGAGVLGLDGSYVLVVHSDASEDEVGQGWTLNAGTYAIEFVLENSLRPGLYKLGLAATLQQYLGRSNLCTLLEGPTLEVLGFSEQGIASRPYATGLVNGKAVWREPTLVDSGKHDAESKEDQ